MLEDKVHRLSASDREQVIAQLREALGRYPEIVFAYLYGSFLEGLGFHDIDVGLFLQSDTQAASQTVALGIAEQLSRKLGLSVDVRILNGAPVSFSFHVLQGLLLIDNDPETRSQFTEQIVARYLDMKPLLRKATKEAFAA